MIPIDKMQNALVIALIKKYDVKEITLTDAEIEELTNDSDVMVYKNYDIKNSTYTFTVKTYDKN